MNKKRKISTHQIEDLVKATPSDRVKVSDLVNAMEGAGFGLTLMICSFGVLIPLPPPAPSIISIPLAIFAFQMMIGLKSPRLPKRIARMTVKRSILITLVRISSPYISRVERILRPRLIFMSSILAERLIGALAFLFSTSILLPIPFSNFIPGLGILIISFGLTSRDGLIMIFGIFVGLIGMIVSAMTIFWGLEVFVYLKNLIF